VSSKPVTENQLRKRLLKAGKTKEEIDSLIDEYAAASCDGIPDETMVSRILRKTEQDRVLRVKGFRLTREQYDILLNHCEESDGFVPGQQVGANFLIEMALKEIVDLIS
jgi:hypothetical protein